MAFYYLFLLIILRKVHGYKKEMHMSDCLLVLDKTRFNNYTTPIILQSYNVMDIPSSSSGSADYSSI